MSTEGKHSNSKPLIITEIIIYGLILVTFLYYFLPLGFK